MLSLADEFTNEFTCLAGDAAAQLMSFPLSAPQSTAFGTALTSKALRTY